MAEARPGRLGRALRGYQFPRTGNLPAIRGTVESWSNSGLSQRFNRLPAQ